MSLSAQKQRLAQIESKRKQLTEERAKARAADILGTSAVRLNQVLISNQINVDDFVSSIVQDITNDSITFTDKLRARGWRPAEIRKVVHKLYNMYCVSVEHEADEALYEEMLEPVAKYVEANPSIYDQLDDLLGR